MLRGRSPPSADPRDASSGLGWKVMEGGDEGGVEVRLGVGGGSGGRGRLEVGEGEAGGWGEGEGGG